MPLWQYQQKAEPLPVITVDKWIPVFPSIVTRVRGLVPQTGISVLPPPDVPVVPLIAKWEPVYPSVLLRNRPRDYNNYSVTLPLAPQRVFVDSWLPAYPNSLYDKKRVIPLNVAFVSLVTVTPAITSIGWVAQYPSIIRGRVNRTALYTNAFIAPLLVVPTDITNYFRRYLNDPATLQTSVGPPVTFATAPDTTFTNYMRRYLNNPL